MNSSTQLQTFRASSSTKVIAIPTRHDPKLGQRVVRWIDIQQQFTNAKGILNGRDPVLFLTNDDLEEIAHYPGVVLEVLTAENNHGHESITGTLDSSSSSIGLTYSTLPTRRDVIPHRTSMDYHDGHSLVQYQNQPSETQTSSNSSNPLCKLGSFRSMQTLRKPSFSDSGSFDNDFYSRHQADEVRQLERRMLHVEESLQQVGTSVQQTQRSMYHSEQQIRQQFDEILHDQHLTHQFEEQTQQHLDDVLQKMQQMQDVNERDRADSSQQGQQPIHHQSEHHIQQLLDETLQKIQLIWERMDETDQSNHSPPDQIYDGISQKQHKMLDGQLEEVLRQTQNSVQSIQYSLERIQRHVQRIQNGTDRGDRLSMNRASNGISHEQHETLSRHIIIQYRVQAYLATRFENLSVPQPFILLPKDYGSVNGQERSSSPHFRLHFLCEYGPYTVTRDTKRTHEFHMTNHSGYDLKKPNEFVDKYGPYVLTVLYMVKYGAMAPGFIVPPLTQSKLVTRIKENHESLGHIKKDIKRLVNDTITYLEGMTSPLDIDTYVLSHWSLSPEDLEELRSHLDVDEDERFPGELYQPLTHSRHSSWACSEHQHDHGMPFLKEMIIDLDGSVTEEQGKITFKANPERLTKLLRRTIVEVCRTQHPNNRPPLTMDFGRLLLAVTTSHRGVRDTVAIVTRLGDLSPEDIEFIQQCCLTKLTIKSTPQEADDNRLVSIIRQSPRLKELHIGCHGGRSLEVIKLVISAREKIYQCGGKSSLQFFKVADEGLQPFNLYKEHDEQEHFAATVVFSLESAVFDMDTRIILQNKRLIVEKSQVFNFVREFGWSITSLNAPWTFSDIFAELLDRVTQISGSRIKQLVLDPFSLATCGLDALNRIIKRSQRLVVLSLMLNDMDQGSRVEMAIPLLVQHGKVLNRLTLYGASVQGWLHRLAQSSLTKSTFPKLSDLGLHCGSNQELPEGTVQWLASMLSDPLESSGSTLGTPQQTMGPPTTPTRLSTFQLYNVTLRQEDWSTLIKAINFSELSVLQLSKTNFSHDQLDLLLERIANVDPMLVALTILELSMTDLLANLDSHAALRMRIKGVVPRVLTLGL
ncbi:hypothetical protein BGX31_007055 [Mortierella sp. GBA43]|nr:hypothetical protein BGX31_007055 [Mortierella sp. GBA43]